MRLILTVAIASALAFAPQPTSAFDWATVDKHATGLADLTTQSTPRLYIIGSGVNGHANVTNGPDYVDGTHYDCAGHDSVTAQIARDNGAGPITSVRVLDCSNWGYNTDIEVAMQWVYTDFVNGGYQPSAVLMAINSTVGQPAWDAILITSTQAGLTWVVSAGNHSNWTMLSSPTRAELWNGHSAAIVVAGANGLAHASPSNFGGEVDLYADNCAYGVCGTSFAAAKVAGEVITVLNGSPWAAAPHITSALTGSCPQWMTAPASGTTSCKR